MNITKLLIEKYDWTKEELAAELKTSVRSVERWRDGNSEPLPGSQDRLENLLRIERENHQTHKEAP